ncbi:MAG: 5-formyltetrahydrofolate cyclo-ligase [Ruminococcaceae bacterium]|nr:5-formyltetrahydrofolate cyclo-ligase [Oscillospiraceae bacterium]
MYEIRKRKNDIRAKYKALREAIEPAKKAEMDEKICTTFVGLATYRYASVLLMYAPKSDEVDIMPIAIKALADGKKVAFPRCIPDTHDMEYHFITSLDQLKKGTYGLLEPTEDLPLYDRESAQPTACIVPALVYDKKGFRLGYGKGYYDRYLGTFTGSKVGMIYSDFIIDTVPRGRFDLSVDFIVTERGIKVNS